MTAKRTKEGRNSLLSDSFGILSLRAVLVPITLLADIALARLYGPVGKGAIAILRDAPGLLALLAGGGIGLASNYRVHEESRSLSRVFATSAAIAGLVGITMSVLLLLDLGGIARLLFAGLPSDLGVAERLAFATIPIEGLFVLGTWLVITGGQPVASATMRFARRTMFLLSIGILVVWSPSLSVGLTLLLSMQAATLLCLVWYSVRRSGIRYSGFDRQLRGLATLAAQSAPLQMAERMQMRLGIVLLSAFALGSDAGLFSVAGSVTNLLVIVAASASTALFGRRLSESPDLHSRVSRLMFPAMAGGATAIGLAGHVLIPLLWGEDFRSSAQVLDRLLPGGVAFGMIHTLSPALVQSGRAGRLSLAHLLGLAVNLSLCLYLIPTQGASGAALATSASAVTTAVVALAMLTVGTPNGVGAYLVPRREDLVTLRQALRRRK